MISDESTYRVNANDSEKSPRSLLSELIGLVMRLVCFLFLTFQEGINFLEHCNVYYFFFRGF